MTEQKPKAPPGWYPDKRMAGTQRYWDGQSWTDKVAPLAPEVPAQKTVSVWTIARGVALGLLCVIAIMVMLTKCQADQDHTDCLTGNLDRASEGLPLLDCD